MFFVGVAQCEGEGRTRNFRRFLTNCGSLAPLGMTIPCIVQQALKPSLVGTRNTDARVVGSDDGWSRTVNPFRSR